MVKSLAKVEDFIEADKYMKKISEIEKKEFVKAQVQKEKKVNFHLNQLGSQQKVEIGSIKQKISAGRDKLIKIKEDERLKLLQKFKNMMQEIQMAQQLEISKFELKYKSYIPDEKINITAKRREGGKSFCLSDAVFASTNTSFSNWGRSSSDLKEKKSLAQQKKTLLDALCSNALSGKTDRSSTNLKHRRTTSMQNFKV